MYAIVRTGGKQYRAEPGKLVKVEKLAGAVGEKVTLSEVLVFADGENIEVGRPVVAGASVLGRIVEQGKGKKITIFKYKRRKDSRRKMGHRQLFTAVLVEAIQH